MIWLEYATQRFGAPLLAPKNDDWVKLHGRCKRRAWAWFPHGENHHVLFDDFGGHVETTMGRNGVGGRHLVLTTTKMPIDDQIVMLLDFVWGGPDDTTTV